MCRWLAVQAGQLAANDAKDERTDAKLEEQVGALELPTNIFTHVEFHSDTVCLESVAARWFSAADLGHTSSVQE